MCPTRELCLQITGDIEKFRPKKSYVHVTAVYGGASIGEQIKSLKKGTQIVVATPGRLIDLIERKAIHLEDINYVVLDEADEMLNMGFKDDIEFILKETINRHSIWLFSATMPPEIRRITEAFQHNPQKVEVSRPATAAVTVTQSQVPVGREPHEKRELLRRLLRDA